MNTPYLKTPVYLLLNLFVLFIAVSCKNASFTNDAVGKTYQFICSNGIQNCSECDKNWFIKFDSDTKATIYSSDSQKSYLKSCQTTIDYVFDDSIGSIKLSTSGNPNVNELCKSNFIGEWVFNENGANGLGFYDTNSCGFIR